MKTLVATALLAYANADETSLLQRSATSNKLAVTSEIKAKDSTAKLLDSAVAMIKNGVTPDVITFVDSTNEAIDGGEESALQTIRDAHQREQEEMYRLYDSLQAEVDLLLERRAETEVHNANRLAASEEHHTCRAGEAYHCAKSRRCEEQLRQKWVTVKHEESVMREIHGYIHDEWCIHPPFFAEIDAWLSHPFNWAQTSPYPILDLPQDVRDFRHVSVGYFHDYREQKTITERAWLEYNEKLEECAVLEEEWEIAAEPCDQAQMTAHEHACQHAEAAREARERFGREWTSIHAEFMRARSRIESNEADRKNEYETLKIVQCLLDHVHSAVVTSLETGAPCPTEDSDPEGVTLAIEDCHVVQRGCPETPAPRGYWITDYTNADSFTKELCIDYQDPPEMPELPPVEDPPCTPAYIAQEQAQFLETIQTSYAAELAANADYSNDPLTAYQTVLSEAGWAGCAPPLVCVDCAGFEPEEPCLEHTGGAATCRLHEEYLSPGQSNANTFRCLDGTCIPQRGRCNAAQNCADGSDEAGCDAESNHFVPAYLSANFACPADFHDDVHFRCANSQCIEKVGMCNGIDNCADGSDEAQCSGSIQVSVEATSGRTITVETLQTHTGVFHDRSYHFDSLGHFTGKTFIKYSNDDKMTDHEHVMTKLRILEPLTVFIVKLDHHSLPWLAMEGYRPTSYTGVSFSGIRDTPHKEWDPSLLTTDHFAASSVYSKTFPAGTVSIPGNNGGDGSFLIFLDRPSTEDEFDNRLSAYWEHGNCGVHGNDWNWGWCGNQAGNCPLTISNELVSEICASGEAELAAFHGTGEAHSYTRDGCDYFWHAQYRCVPHVPQVHGEAEYIGCFVDDGARDLGAMVGGRDNAATNTFELCRAACGDSIYMSLQYGGECFCANDYATAPQYVQVDESNCNANVEPCASTSHNCGGTWHQAIYQINAITEWEMIAHHEFGGPEGFFPAAARNSFVHNANNPSASAFMSVGNLDAADYMADGKFHFKLVYTDVVDAHTACNGGDALTGTIEAEWTQTSWITETDVTGFEAIRPSNLGTAPGGAGCMFTGLARSSSGSTIMDGSHDHSWWFGSVGSTVAWHGGIPALFGGDAQSMTLYVMTTSGGVVTPAPEPQCGALPELTNAAWIEGTLQYQCDEGFSFSLQYDEHLVLDVECLANGQYTEVHRCIPLDDCVGHSCGAFGTCVDQHMDYTCNCLSGFEMTTDDVTGEKLCGNVDDCHGHMCGEAGTCVDLVNDYDCQCEDGWRQVVRHEDDLKTCERVECGDVPDIDNVVSMAATGLYPWSRSKAVFEETVEFFCASGHSTNGQLDGPHSFTIMCQADGSYSAAQECLPISCGAPEPAGGANPVSSAAVRFGETIDYSCPHGYGPESFGRTCMENGQYSPAIACEPRLCGTAPLFPMTTGAHEGIFFFGQSVEYHCAAGYSTDAAIPSASDFTVECLADGWDTAVVGCVPVTCEVVHDDTHTPVAPYTIDFGSINIVTCADGYTSDGTGGGATHLFSECSPSGVAQLASCRPVTCPAATLMTGLHSAVQEHRDYTIGNRATYTCSEGHAVALTGATTFEVECLRSGMFSAMSTCRNIDDCEGHSCGSNGRCVDGINDYSCACESGFEETVSASGEKMCGNINDCGPNACGPHGACHDLVNGYSCECDTGYPLQGTGDDQLCVAQVCQIPAAANTIVTTTELTFPQTLFIECERGYEIQHNQDNFMVMCSPDGEIMHEGSTTLPQCAPKVCGQPPNNFGAEHQEVRSYHFGETSVSMCAGGEVQITHECNADGVFVLTSEFSTCMNSCGTPTAPAHAHRSSQWTMVLQYGASAYTPNTGAVGTLDESAKQFAKLSDAAINALPSGGESAYDYYMLTSESATANARDTLFMRVQGAYSDSSVVLGFSSWEVCTASSIEACTSWSVAQGGTHGIDTYYPSATNDCRRWFTGYQNSILCYPQQNGGRCWATGNTCSIGSHAIRQDVKMYKLTGGAGAVVHPASATFTCDDGYTPLASGQPGQAFSQACRATGAFEALTQTCVPVVCQRPAAPQNWEWVTNNALNTQSPAYLRCASGHTSMQSGSDGRFQCTCNSDGQISQLPDPCVVEEFVITGRVRNAIRPTQGVASATLVVAGQTITTNGNGHYSVTLPVGTYSYSINAHGFITIPSGTITVTAAGTFDISMSPSLAADSWRLVLTWDQNPRDLDSHLQFYGEESRCPEMYYGRRSANCDNVNAALDVDDVNSWGPETTTLTGVNSCGGNWWTPWITPRCQWVYKVKNYSGYYDRNHGWQHSQAKVQLYNGDHMVREFEVNSGHGHTQDSGQGSPSYWSVVRINGDGTYHECTTHNCD